MYTAFVLALTLGWSATLDPPELPMHMEYLMEFKNDEQRLFKEVRLLHHKERTYAQWDMAMAGAKKDGNDAITMSAKDLRVRAEGRYATMRLAWEYFLALYDKNPRAHTYYGELLYDHYGEQVMALKEWKMARAIDPTYAAPCNDLGLHYSHIGQVAMGIAYLNDAIRYDRKNADYCFNLAQLYLTYDQDVAKYKGWSKKRIYREAMKLSGRAARLAPGDYELLQDYAMNFFAADRFGLKHDGRKAAAAWAAARERARDDAERFNAWLNEGRAWLLAKKTEKALTCLRNAQKMRPESEVVNKLIMMAEQPPAPPAKKKKDD